MGMGRLGRKLLIAPLVAVVFGLGLWVATIVWAPPVAKPVPASVDAPVARVAGPHGASRAGSAVGVLPSGNLEAAPKPAALTGIASADPAQPVTPPAVARPRRVSPQVVEAPNPELQGTPGDPPPRNGRPPAGKPGVTPQ